MAKGRKKDPSAIQKLKGEKRPCRTNKKEPKPKRGKGKEIKIVDDIEKIRSAYLKYFIDVLSGMKVLTEADKKQVEIYCKACADEVYFTKILDEQGWTYENFKMDTAGNEIRELKIHPLAVRLEKARDAINRYGSVLGLNPADRSKLEVPGEPEKEGIETFLTGKK